MPLCEILYDCILNFTNLLSKFDNSNNKRVTLNYWKLNYWKLCRCWTNLSWSVKQCPIPPKLSWRKRKLLRGAFYSFCLDYPQKKGNIRVTLVFTLAFLSILFTEQQFRQYYYRNLWWYFPAEARTQLFIGLIHSRGLSDFECWQYSSILGFQVRSRRPCWCTEKWSFWKKTFGNLILLLCKTWATFCQCFVHQVFKFSSFKFI